MERRGAGTAPWGWGLTWVPGYSSGSGGLPLRGKRNDYCPHRCDGSKGCQARGERHACWIHFPWASELARPGQTTGVDESVKRAADVMVQRGRPGVARREPAGSGGCGALPVTSRLLAPGSVPTLALSSSSGDRRKAAAGGFFWQTPGVTRAHGLAPQGVQTLPQGPQHLPESGRREGSDRLAGRPH